MEVSNFHLFHGIALEADNLGPGLLTTQKSDIIMCTRFGTTLGRSYMNFLPKRTTAIIIGLYCASWGRSSLPAIEKDYSPQRHLPSFLPST